MSPHPRGSPPPPLESDFTKPAWTVALAVKNLSKHFSDFRAVDDVSLNIYEGEIHALIGPNGAGKTTFFNLLTGFLKPTKGQIQFFGRDITGKMPSDLARMGLARSFQISSVFSTLTPLENLTVALQVKSRHPMRFFESQRVLRQFEPRALEILEQIGLSAQKGVPAATLSYGQKRSLEIGLSIALEPRILLLDEPTSGMGGEDISRVISLIAQVAVGRTVVMVEHNMGVVSELSHRITVLQRGTVLTSGSYDTVRQDPRVIEAYLGSEVSA